MKNQEIIYQLLYQGQWNALTHILYNERNAISGDPILTHAAKTFEAEFLRKVADYPLSDEEVLQNLEKLYVLHNGKFYELDPGNYKTLVLELVKRKPLKEAINYARLFPEEQAAQNVIQTFEASGANGAKLEEEKITQRTWVEIYNRLFELVNNQSDTATYFSGPRFINTVRKTLTYHPTYEQFMAIRKKEGRSTTRKDYYYDILFEMSEKDRVRVVENILELLRPFEPVKASAIEAVMGRPVHTGPSIAAPSTKNKVPKAFISYSWDDPEHEAWILNLAERLSAKGIDVVLDKYSLRAGDSVPHFMENAISDADKIIVIFTPNYKVKADGRKGGVGYEYSIMNAQLYRAQTFNRKIIPVLRAGSMEDSIPEFMHQYLHIDMSRDEEFESVLEKLAREIHGEPLIKKPAIGEKPNYD
ncbi:MAG: TIR domain-containing protein [Proteobacteria bacterium]|nr:MAG: TIR domain-containing protein [Pseudomonadota bacterium]